jgi:hypothetical protein
MAKLRRSTRLALEATHQLGDLHQVGEQHLDRYFLPELRVDGLEDDAHPALTEDAFDSILSPEDFPDGRERRLHGRQSKPKPLEGLGLYRLIRTDPNDAGLRDHEKRRRGEHFAG